MDGASTAHRRTVRVVEMRFFGGLSVDETAAALNVSPGTVMRDWSSAKANGTHSRLSLSESVIPVCIPIRGRSIGPSPSIARRFSPAPEGAPVKREQLAADSRKRMVHRGTETDDQTPFDIRKSRCDCFRSEPPPG